MTLTLHCRRLAGAWAAAATLAAAAPSAAQTAPPKERGVFHKPDLVELIHIDPTLKLDIKYATPNNFAGRTVYAEARAFLQRTPAEALARAHRKLKERGYGIIVFDGYRPWSVTKHFWDVTPPGKKKYVANPYKGSRHNRGAAVDLTIYALNTGLPVEMPSEYDEFTERAAVDYKGGTESSRRNRDLLRVVMESEGFAPHSEEWWHYDFRGWEKYPLSNLSFAEIGRAQGAGTQGTPGTYGTPAAAPRLTPAPVPTSILPPQPAIRTY